MVPAAVAIRATSSTRAGLWLCSRPRCGSSKSQSARPYTSTDGSIIAAFSTSARRKEADRLSAAKPNGVHAKSRKQTGARKVPQQTALLRLDPRHPLLPSLTPAASSSESSESQTLRQRKAKSLGQLHAALQTGSTEAVWNAYLDHRKYSTVDETPFSIYHPSSDSALSAAECESVLRLISNDATKTKRGANRILRLMADIRGQQRRLLFQLQLANDANDSVRSRLLRRELDAWDSVVSPKVLNATIAHIGRSLRSVGLEEIDLMLDQLLSYEANEHSRRSAASHSKTTQNHMTLPGPTGVLYNLRSAMLSPVARSRLSQRRGKQRQADFPDLSTYNTILNVITNTIHRSKTKRRLASEQVETFEEEQDDDQVAKFAEMQHDSRTAELDTSIVNKLRRLDLDSDAMSLHADEYERADRLFHSVLERMQRRNRIEPDAVTFSIMITMYCLLDRWDMVHRVVRSANKQMLLNIDCINNAMWHWLVRGPASTSRHDRSFTHADAIESAFEVYRQLRQNSVQAELASQNSSILYGQRDMVSEATSCADRNEHLSQDELGPLAWPDRDGPKLTRTHSNWSNSSRSLQNDAVQAVLGIPSLPLQLVPDEITHALMISSLTREGRFADALSVFKDLVSTRTRQAGKSAGDTRASNVEAEAEESKMQPTLAIFDSFFKGFSRHGRPSKAVRFDAQHAECSEWELVPNAASQVTEVDIVREAPHASQDSAQSHQLQLWRIETFQEIFSAFLDHTPDLSQALGPSSRVARVDRSSRSVNRNISTPFGWLTLAEKRKMDAIRRAPSPNQLFWILTAIRRVSGDHAAWSLAMWQKVVDKFDPTVTGSSGKVNWTGFRLDNRLRRVVEHLEAQLAQDHLATGQARTEVQALT